MTDTVNSAAGSVIARARHNSGEDRPAPRSDARRVAPVTSPDRSVYLTAARTLLPHWLHMIGPSPWYDGCAKPRAAVLADRTAMSRQLAAALATGVLTEVDLHRPDRAHLRECVRAALIRWQLSLRGDGRPEEARSARDPLHVVAAAWVVLLLSETSGLQTSLLLTDLANHLTWLSQRPHADPWVEAALCGALADGAMLTRDTGLLKRARHRLESLLARQSQEGWFPENGGADTGRLSLTIDALARVHRHIGWPELIEPLRRAISFLGPFVRSDGRAGGCYNTGDTAFVSPYGPELLASSMPEAAGLAAACRRWYMALAPDRILGRCEDVCSVLGVGAAMCALGVELPRVPCADVPDRLADRVHFPHAGFTVVTTKSYRAVASTRRGGSLQVVWHNGAADIEDAGVIVLYAHGARTAGRAEPDEQAERDLNTLTYRSTLGRSTSPTPMRKDRLRPWMQALARLRCCGSTASSTGRTPRFDYRSLAHDWSRRRITFQQDTIRIEDSLRCRLPCSAVVVQSPAVETVGPFAEAGAGNRIGRPPLFIEGGRRIDITRVYRNGVLVEFRCG
jgi:hypothetical protein